MTESGYGKRTSIDEYRLTSRGAKGVKTITFTETKGLLSGALVVREHQDLVFISQNGMVQRTGVRGINRYGRTSQGVKVMNLREGDVVSAVALVVESEAPTAAPVAELDELAARGDARRSTDEIARRARPTRSPRRPSRAGRTRTRRSRCGAPPRGSLLFGSPEKGGGPKLSDSSCGTLEVPGR